MSCTLFPTEQNEPASSFHRSSWWWTLQQHIIPYTHKYLFNIVSWSWQGLGCKSSDSYLPCQVWLHGYLIRLQYCKLFIKLNFSIPVIEMVLFSSVFFFRLCSPSKRVFNTDSLIIIWFWSLKGFSRLLPMSEGDNHLNHFISWTLCNFHAPFCLHSVLEWVLECFFFLVSSGMGLGMFFFLESFIHGHVFGNHSLSADYQQTGSH